MTPPRNPKYGRRHDIERKKWAATVDRGDAYCWRCGKWLDPAHAWDLGHGPGGEGYMGPECVKCNRADGARTTNRRRSHRRNGFGPAKSPNPMQPDHSPWAAKARACGVERWSRDWYPDLTVDDLRRSARR